MVGRMQKFSALNHLHPKEIIPQNLSSSSVSTVSEELRNKQTQTHLYLIVYKKDYHYKDIVRVLKWQTCMPYNFLPRICKLLYLDWLYDPKESSFYISLNPKRTGILANLILLGVGTNLPNHCIWTMSALTKKMLSKHSFY